MFTSIQDLYDIYTSHPHVCTDTRKVQRGELFFALRGANFDGNDFALTALQEGGAAFAVVDRPELADHPGCLFVEDTLHTLQLLAREHRRRMGLLVLAITGTNGKTTTKELCLAVLKRHFRTCATIGNLNNHIGVPLTLLSIHSDTQVAIVEMGASAPGDIRDLVEIAEPNIGLVTNIGSAHLKGFGSVEGVLRTKSELPEYLIEHGGDILLNSDDPLLYSRWSGRSTYTYGTGGSYVQGRAVTSFPTLQVEWDNHTICTHLVGSYNLPNVLAATAVGKYFGIPDKEIIAGIESYTPTNHRSQLLQAKRDITLIADSYNANPSSMRAAVDNLLSAPIPTRVAILGDMLELGEAEEKEHRALLEYLLPYVLQGALQLLLCGPAFALTVEQMGIAKSAPTFTKVDALLLYLAEHPLPAGSLVLVKGSHGVSLDRLLEPGCLS